MKDEGANPTGSFKARGISCAVTMCKEFGIGTVATATAGNAGGALAAYSAAAGIKAVVFMPKDTPQVLCRDDDCLLWLTLGLLIWYYRETTSKASFVEPTSCS